jgi:hypothetical protein
MEIVLAILGSSALASLISGVISLIANRKKQETGVEAGVRILLYDRIKHLGIKYIERGYITHDEYEDLGRMHNVYHNALNGNGFLDNIMEQVNELPRHRE